MNLGPELQAILTVVIVGLISFLIGWLLTSSKWKKKYRDAQLQSDQLVSQTTTLSADLNKTKTQLAKLKTTNKNLERSVEENETKLGILQRNLLHAQQNSKAGEVSKLKVALDQEKSNASNLRMQVKTLEAKPIMSTPVVVKKKKKAKTTDTGSASKKKSGKKKKLKKIMTKIGAGSSAHVDDLSVITGIGPEISSKLNDMGIVNYRQLSRLEDADLEVIDKALKFFPGRAYRNNWIGQAKVLADKGMS